MLLKSVLGVLIWMCIFLWRGMSVYGASLYGNGNITFSPDGRAFTTDAGERAYISYPKGTEVGTGNKSSLRELSKGEHYYLSPRNGEIPVGKWTVMYTPGQCIHNRYGSTPNWHGISYGKQKCGSFFKSGWIADCADCGEEIAVLFYMDLDTANSLKSLPAGMDYYYLCPVCRNLEQGTGIIHNCKKISYNRYTIRYDKNDRFATGIMEDSDFYYNNSKEYEGMAVMSETCLRKNAFRKNDAVFMGWNTKADGSGQSFTDGQQIRNLTSDDKVTLVLYAQWKKGKAYLKLDPGGGSFAGKEEPVVIEGLLNSTYSIGKGSVIPPRSLRISFDSKGGERVEAMSAPFVFSQWELSREFRGKLINNEYVFPLAEGNVDVLRAQYIVDKIRLPETQKEGMIFGGWYEDVEESVFAGKANEWYEPKADVTLYAKWIPENVGNCSIEASVERILSPHTPVFQCGESGILRIQTTGYVERIRISFPPEIRWGDMPSEQEIRYPVPTEETTEEMTFMIPLRTVQNRDYRIRVTGYKSGTNLEENPVFCEFRVTGSVLNELKTRLR